MHSNECMNDSGITFRWLWLMYSNHKVVTGNWQWGGRRREGWNCFLWDRSWHSLVKIQVKKKLLMVESEIFNREKRNSVLVQRTKNKNQKERSKTNKEVQKKSTTRKRILSLMTVMFLYCIFWWLSYQYCTE